MKKNLFLFLFFCAASFELSAQAYAPVSSTTDGKNVKSPTPQVNESKAGSPKFVTLPNSTTVVETKADGTTEVHFNTKRDSTYYNSYNKLKNICISMLQSSEYKIVKEKTAAFRAKMLAPDGIYPKGLGQKESILDWLKINWKNTRFSSYEDAKKSWDELLVAQTTFEAGYPEYSELYLKLTMEYGPDLFIELMEDIHNNYSYLLFE